MSLNRKYPKFSVLMSVYKNEKPEYLDLALRSVENQTIKPNEIIVVEDGPISKQLKEIVIAHKSLFGINFKDVVSKKNKGLGAALRLGTKYVSTNWIARMDSDDYSMPDRFEKQLNAIIDNPNLAVVGGQVNEFSSTIKNIVGKRIVPVTETNIKKFVKWRSPFNHPTVFLNKEKLLRVGGYQPFGNLEDYYLWARIISSNLEVENLDDYLVSMRVDEGMYSRRGKISNLRYFFALRGFLRKKKIINFSEELAGDAIMTANIVVPGNIRELLYRKVLHK